MSSLDLILPFVHVHSTRHSFLSFSLFLWMVRYSAFCKWEISPCLFRPQLRPNIFYSRLFVHVYFSCSSPAARSHRFHVRNALSHLHRWLSHGLVVSRCVWPIICRIISISKIEKSRSTHRRRNTLSTCRRSCPALLTRLTSRDSPWAIIFSSIVR